MKKEEDSDFNYLEQVDNLWYNVQKKVEEKLFESCKIMREELNQIQSRHRQFYRVQLVVKSLDKFQPSYLLKEEKKKDKKQKKGF